MVETRKILKSWLPSVGFALFSTAALSIALAGLFGVEAMYIEGTGINLLTVMADLLYIGVFIFIASVLSYLYWDMLKKPQIPTPEDAEEECPESFWPPRIDEGPRTLQCKKYGHCRGIAFCPDNQPDAKMSTQR